MKKHDAGIFSGNIFGGGPGLGQTTSTSTSTTTPTLPEAAPDSLISQLATGGGSKSTTSSGGKSVSSSFDTSSLPVAPGATNYTPWIIGGVAIVGVLGAVMLMSGRRGGTVAANRRRRVRRNRRRSRR